jgi:hypothetical protein
MRQSVRACCIGREIKKIERKEMYVSMRSRGKFGSPSRHPFPGKIEFPEKGVGLAAYIPRTHGAYWKKYSFSNRQVTGNNQPEVELDAYCNRESATEESWFA